VRNARRGALSRSPAFAVWLEWRRHRHDRRGVSLRHGGSSRFPSRWHDAESSFISSRDPLVTGRRLGSVVSTTHKPQENPSCRPQLLRAGWTAVMAEMATSAPEDGKTTRLRPVWFPRYAGVRWGFIREQASPQAFRKPRFWTIFSPHVRPIRHDRHVSLGVATRAVAELSL